MEPVRRIHHIETIRRTGSKEFDLGLFPETGFGIPERLQDFGKKGAVMSIRIGVQLHPQHCSYSQIIRAAQEIDQLGCDTLWTWDHFFPMYGETGAPIPTRKIPENLPEQGFHFEGWTLLTAMACHTRHIEIGMLVSANPYRNPQLLADMARTLDHISEGRLILGLGAGWYDKDHQEYGFPFEGAAVRARNLERSLHKIRERLSRLDPPPTRRPLPLLIGGGGERITLRLAAEYAQIWNGAGPPEVIAHKISVLKRWCERVGRDFQTLETSVLTYDLELSLLEQYRQAGVTHLMVGLGTPFDLEAVRAVLRWRDQLKP